MREQKIIQVIGCAYTYRISQAIRRKSSTNRPDHSSHKGKKAFSYFKKVEKPEHIRRSGEDLLLRRHPETQKSVLHWYEPELAIVLGARHSIAAYALANDLTAAEIEFEMSRPGYDPTYYGKCWPGSCALGSFVAPEQVEGFASIEIGLRIERGGGTAYDRKYSTASRKWDFDRLPMIVLDYWKSFGRNLPKSKEILVHAGFLPPGTVILAGTGLVPKKQGAEEGDVVTVYSPVLGELKNIVRVQNSRKHKD